MRFRFILCVLLAAFLAGGCSAAEGKSSTRRDKSTSTSTTRPIRVGPARLLITPSGVTVGVIGKEANRWRVRTPCGLTTTVTDGRPVSHIEVVIDPGHGGMETGAVANGLYESTVNLQVASELQRELNAAGIPAALTRTGDYRVPIATRADFVNTVNPKLFVSVQHNGGNAAHRDGPGTEVYYQHDSADAKRLAGLVWANVFAASNAFAAHWVGASDAGAIYRLGREGDDFYGVLRLTRGTPAVLVEASYISDASEAALLSTSTFRSAEAKGLATGIERYLTTTDAGSGFHNPIPRGYEDDGGGRVTGCHDPELG